VVRCNIGSSHIVEVADETVNTAEYFHKGASGNSLWATSTIPASVPLNSDDIEIS
jgi:hypothetical protein